MNDSPQRRYVRWVRNSSPQQKAGLLVLVVAMLALAASLSTARERLAKADRPGGGARANADTVNLGSETP